MGDKCYLTEIHTIKTLSLLEKSVLRKKNLNKKLGSNCTFERIMAINNLSLISFFIQFLESNQSMIIQWVLSDH